jgi:ribosomal protein S18 acetylase RimI-like enzyme
MTFEPLDDPVWSSLTGAQEWASEGTDRARRYHPDVSVFAAIREVSPSAWDDLRALVGPGRVAVLFRADRPEPPPGWSVVFEAPGFQLVLGEARRPSTPVPAMLELGPHDVAAMVDLVERTKPGPFTRRTIELGTYLGLFDGERLVAMAGERMRPDGASEISAVCTDEGHRGRGLGAHLTLAVADRIRGGGRVPFLHVVATNPARRLYEELGFTERVASTALVVRAPK